MKHDFYVPDASEASDLPDHSDRRAAIARHIEALEDLAEPASRIDGWSPLVRKVFLNTLAECGRVSSACQFSGRSKQSAYALRARDPLFATGWDAACELARTQLADALYEQAVDGVTETFTRDDGSTVTRHRFDSRLSVAVLNRLDRRCDRAVQEGSSHLGVVARWTEFTTAVGADDHGAAQAIIDAAAAAKLSQASQLPHSGSPASEACAAESDHLWFDEDAEEWRTDLAPPAGFDGDEYGRFGTERYSRTLDAEELAIIGGFEHPVETRRVDNEQARASFFAALRAELEDDAALEAQQSEPEEPRAVGEPGAVSEPGAND